jgi:phosphatidylinositol alpha-1,6-mannosyltransferase
VTNDFPPRQGGIENFVYQMAVRFPPDSVVVYTSSTRGAAEHDARLPFPVVRARTRVLLPTPGATRAALRLMAQHGCDSVWFGAAAPLGLMGAELRRRARAERIVATTHAHEQWWAKTAPTRRALRAIGEAADTVTYIAENPRAAVASALTPAAAARMVRLTPGVAPADFSRDPEAGAAVRARYRLGERPVILCASRLVERKGQDTLLRALPAVLVRHPEAVLLLAGKGPHEAALKRLADQIGLRGSVLFAGGLPHDRMPGVFAAATVFAMPTRSRLGGFEAEGLPTVYLEAAASGLPVIAGDSGGSAEAVRQGETGFVVDGTDPVEVAARLNHLLEDPERARAMGQTGRQWAADAWDWDQRQPILATLLGHP